MTTSIHLQPIEIQIYKNCDSLSLLYDFCPLLYVGSVTLSLNLPAHPTNSASRVTVDFSVTRTHLWVNVQSCFGIIRVFENTSTSRAGLMRNSVSKVVTKWGWYYHQSFYHWVPLGVKMLCQELKYPLDFLKMYFVVDITF